MSIPERLGIVGSGAIACGLAAAAARHDHVLLVARSPESAERAEATVHKVCGRLSGAVNARHVKVSTDEASLDDRTFLIEAIVEDKDVKAATLARVAERVDGDAVIATTTSSLSVEELAAASGRPERFVAFHVFNPVPQMKLVELAFPTGAGGAVRDRARALCAALGKTAVEVPDMPGFVVNRLLFPFLFSAVRLQEETGLSAEAIDDCMKLGAGHPMGPLALLDFVGLDVAVAIGETIGTPIPERVQGLVAEGALGKKSKRGFYEY